MPVLGGVQATLRFQGSNLAGGFVAVSSLKLDCDLQQWTVGLAWYLTKSAYDERLGSLSSSEPNETLPEFVMPYVDGQDPMAAAKAVIASWFEDSVIV